MSVLVGEAAEFDHHSSEHAVDPVASYRSIREGDGVVRSPCHGGFTALTRFDDCVGVAKNNRQFSSALELPGGEGFGGGITLPHNPSASRMSLAEMDVPEWHRVRRILNPTLSSEAVRRFVPQILDVTNRFIDGFIESGECDLVFDMCSPVPSIITLRYLGLPTDEWEKWATPIHTSMYTPRRADHPEFVKLGAAFEWIFDQIRLAIADRHTQPREDDLISRFMYDDGDGPGLDDDLIFETVYTMIAAGIDTTTTLLSSALFHLSEHEEDRRSLIDNPTLLADAAEEFLRFYTPAQATARTACEQVEVAGVHLDRGDRVLLAWASANRDEARFPEADEFKINRQPNRHVAFGHGIHRCIGAPLARQEFIVVLGELLRRIPDYVVDTTRSPTYPDLGLAFGYERMPATFTPGPREDRTYG